MSKGNDTTSDDEPEEDRKPPARVVMIDTAAARQQKSSSAENSLASTASSTALTAPNQMPTTVSLSLPFATATLPPAYSRKQNEYGKYAAVAPKRAKNLRSLKQLDANTRLVGQSSSKSKSKKALIKSTSTASIGESRQQSQQLVILLAGTGMVAYASFLVTVLPAAALMALAIIISVFCLLCYVLYLQSRRELQHLLATRGIGDFLPSGLFNTLTQQSLDEFLTDPTTFLEYRHLIIYFLPLSDAQRQAYLDRLAPHHRANLLRPGLGWFVGPDWMRLLLGDERWPAAAPVGWIEQEDEPEEDSMEHDDAAVPPTASRPLDDEEESDYDSDLGPDLHGDDVGLPMSDQQAARLARRVGPPIPPSAELLEYLPALPGEQTVVTTTTNNREVTMETLQAAYAEEERLLAEAMAGSAGNFIWTAWSMMLGWFIDAVPTRSIVRYSAGLSVLSTGALGIWAYWQNVLPWPLLSINGRGGITRGQHSQTNSSSFWATVVLGSASLSLSLVAGSFLLPTRPSPRRDTCASSKRNKNSTPNKDTKKGKPKNA